jgi:hypothetical protein
MTPAALALVAEFEAAAKTAQTAEAHLRKTMAEQIGRLERQRHFAFRRTRLIRTLAAVADKPMPEAETESEARPESPAEPRSEPGAIWAEQRRAVRDELGWTGESKAHDAILAQLEPVGQAVWQCASATQAGVASAVQSELEKFEIWFEGTHGGASFYALFDQYVQEVPVVDF